jgi:hypothetical protein
MRLMGFAVALAILTSCSVAGTTEGPMEVRTLAEGGYGRSDARGAVSALDESTYRRHWQTLISAEEPLPPVDFATESVVFLTAGQYPTGGHVLKFNGATIEGDTLIIDAVVEGPARGSMTTQAITSPYLAIAVKNRAYKQVSWK